MFRYLHTIVSGVVYKINICYAKGRAQYRRAGYPTLPLEWTRLMYGRRSAFRGRCNEHWVEVKEVITAFEVQPRLVCYI